MPPAEPTPPARAQSLRVLVVEDDPDTAESMDMLLALYGYAVRRAATGPAALELAAAFDPEVVLLDIGLKGMSGYDVARQLTAGRPAKRTPLMVAVSGYGGNPARAAECGIDLHMVKPIVFTELEAVLARFRGLLDGLAAPGGP